MVRKGADIKKKDNNGETVLYYGLNTGVKYEALVRLFRNYSGDLNAVNRQGVG